MPLPGTESAYPPAPPPPASYHEAQEHWQQQAALWEAAGRPDPNPSPHPHPHPHEMREQPPQPGAPAGTPWRWEELPGAGGWVSHLVSSNTAQPPLTEALVGALAEAERQWLHAERVGGAALPGPGLSAPPQTIAEAGLELMDLEELEEQLGAEEASPDYRAVAPDYREVAPDYREVAPDYQEAAPNYREAPDYRDAAPDYRTEGVGLGGFSPAQLQRGHYSPAQGHAQHGEPMQAPQHYAPMHAPPPQYCGPTHAPQQHWGAMPAPPPNACYSQHMALAMAAAERSAMRTPPTTLQEKFVTYVMCDFTPRDPTELPMSLWASTGRLIRQLQPHAPAEVAQLGNGRIKQLISEWYTNHPAFLNLPYSDWCKRLKDMDNPGAPPRSQVFKFSFEYTPGGAC